MKRKLMMLLAPTAILLGLSTVSFAGIAANGSFGFGVLGCCTVTSTPPNDLMNATDITFGTSPSFLILSNDALTFGSPNDFQGLYLSFGSISPNTLDLT